MGDGGNRECVSAWVRRCETASGGIGFPRPFSHLRTRTPRTHFVFIFPLLRGSSVGFTYVIANGPLPVTATTVWPLACAQCAWFGAIVPLWPAAIVFSAFLSTLSPMP